MLHPALRISLSRDMTLPSVDADLRSDWLGLLRQMAPETSFAIEADGRMIGYLALIPGSDPRYCHAALYVSPVARNLGTGFRSLALALGRTGIAMANDKGFRASAAHPKSDGQFRYAQGLGGAESGVSLVSLDSWRPDPAPYPVLLWRFEDDGLDAEEVVRRCLPAG